jgi:hypothetical protein
MLSPTAAEVLLKVKDASGRLLQDMETIIVAAKQRKVYLFFISILLVFSKVHHSHSICNYEKS